MPGAVDSFAGLRRQNAPAGWDDLNIVYNIFITGFSLENK